MQTKHNGKDGGCRRNGQTVTLSLLIRKDVLTTIGILDGGINSIGEGEITNKLLMLENLKLKNNVQLQIVSEINFYRTDCRTT